MSVTIATDVFCNVCSNWAHYRTGTRSYATAALKGALKAGWTVTEEGKSICPECNGSKKRGEYWGLGINTAPTLPKG